MKRGGSGFHPCNSRLKSEKWYPLRDLEVARAFSERPPRTESSRALLGTWATRALVLMTVVTLLVAAFESRVEHRFGSKATPDLRDASGVPLKLPLPEERQVAGVLLHLDPIAIAPPPELGPVRETGALVPRLEQRGSACHLLRAPPASAFLTA